MIHMKQFNMRKDQPGKVSSLYCLGSRRHCITSTTKRRMGVGDFWEDPRAGEAIVHSCLIVTRDLAFHAVASFASVFGKIPEGKLIIEGVYQKTSPGIGSVILNLVSPTSIV